MSKLIEAPSRFLWKKEATTWTSIHIYHCRLHDDDIDHIDHINHIDDVDDDDDDDDDDDCNDNYNDNNNVDNEGETTTC